LYIDRFYCGARNVFRDLLSGPESVGYKPQQSSAVRALLKQLSELLRSTLGNACADFAFGTQPIFFR
jgi:hypothetical protein